MNSWDTVQSKGTLVVIGQGYVGLPVAMRAVEVGYTVVGLDTDTVRVPVTSMYGASGMRPPAT